MRERTIYWIVGGILGVLLIVMLVAWNYDRQNDEADAKAQELIAAFEEAGLTAPDQDQIARTLGDDGGQVCETADSELVQGYWKLRLLRGGEYYIRPSGSTGGSARACRWSSTSTVPRSAPTSRTSSRTGTSTTPSATSVVGPWPRTLSANRSSP